MIYYLWLMSTMWTLKVGCDLLASALYRTSIYLKRRWRRYLRYCSYPRYLEPLFPQASFLFTMSHAQSSTSVELMADTLFLTGACEGSVSCSTCHVILSPEHYDKLEEADDEENDMLGMSCLSYLVGRCSFFFPFSHISCVSPGPAYIPSST
jgi:hypothetical protein